MTEIEKKDTGIKKVNPIVIAIIAVLVIVLGVKFYLDHQEKKEMEAFFQEELASADFKLEEISKELEEKIQEIDSLGGSVEDLIAAKVDVESERDQLQRTRTANRKLITRLRAKTEGYEELLKAKDKEIEQLGELNEALLSENTDLKVEKNELNKSINTLSATKEKLEDKVALASRLEVENLMVYAVSKGGKEREGSFRRKQVEKIKIQFDIAQNDVAPIEGKEIFIRVIDPNEQIIFDVSKGSGTFIIDGKEEFYTALQSIVFDNSGQQLSFEYTKGSEYIAGQYKIEVLTDGYNMGERLFTIK